MTVMQFKALALATALGIAAAVMGCAQTGGGTSGSGSSGPYGSAVPGSTTTNDPSLNVACQNVPAIERDACMAREKERRGSTVRGS